LSSRDGQITTTCQWRIGRHLGLQDHYRQLGLIGGRQEQPIEPVFPFLQHRRAEPIADHPRQEGSHQGLQALGVLLEQPVEGFVAGDHGAALVSTGCRGERRAARSCSVATPHSR
jgi:hypothetical protein